MILQRVRLTLGLCGSITPHSDPEFDLFCLRGRTIRTPSRLCIRRNLRGRPTPFLIYLGIQVPFHATKQRVPSVNRSYPRSSDAFGGSAHLAPAPLGRPMSDTSKYRRSRSITTLQGYQSLVRLQYTSNARYSSARDSKLNGRQLRAGVMIRGTGIIKPEAKACGRHHEILFLNFSVPLRRTFHVTDLETRDWCLLVLAIDKESWMRELANSVQIRDLSGLSYHRGAERSKVEHLGS
ncbi:hypothetical protein BS47DRAFT_1486466 [Hydnum rufescens UP504]|uniref:Uncharacterized protein n=1 Tax=Hydnum rufescens UP504 TaxID=1448309 RepID=A0A9P6AU58_9AGAM|nr:hypothetical protein BS47DRAFT_1486466 [Hydnum rufescens UP504]